MRMKLSICISISISIQSSQCTVANFYFFLLCAPLCCCCRRRRLLCLERRFFLLFGFCVGAALVAGAEVALCSVVVSASIVNWLADVVASASVVVVDAPSTACCSGITKFSNRSS